MTLLTAILLHAYNQQHLPDEEKKPFLLSGSECDKIIEEVNQKEYHNNVMIKTYQNPKGDTK